MLKITFLLIAFYLALLLLHYLFQQHLIYYPSKFAPSPTEAGVPEMEEITLTTSYNLKIKAWYRPASNSQQPTVVYLHGNAGNIGHRAPIVRPFLDEGYGVLLLTYRGYSGNPGSPNEEGLYNDARAALDFLKDRECLVLYGNSIGAAVAIQMATEYPVKALVLQSPFTSLGDVGKTHYPFFPVKWFLKDKYDSMTKVDKIDAPVLILHGESDRIIPSKLSRKLFDALPEPKEAKYFPNKGHNDLFEPQAVIDFIKQIKCLEF